MAVLNTLEASNVVLPKDLVITAQPNIDTNYFTVTAKGLEVDSSYNFQFQWVYADGTVGPWSTSVFLITPTESVPGAPSVTVPGTSTGYIPVTLSTFPANALRVDVKVTGGDLGSGKLVHSFTSAGTITVAAKAGFYYVELYTVTPTGINGTPTSVFEITVSDSGEVIQPPTNPNGFSAVPLLAGIQLSWNGTYANGTFTGFEAIKIYAGTSATATAGTYTEVGVITGNNVKNTITIPVDGTYVAYGQAVYIHAAAVNKANPPVIGTIQANVANVLAGPGKANLVDIANGVIAVNNLEAGDIKATSYIRAGAKAIDGTGARVEISSSTITQPGTNVLPGFYIYNSAGTPVLSAPLGGGLSITGSGTFTGSITGASGQFNGDLGASGGTFTVRSGIVTALAGEIGGWKITDSSIYSSNNTSVNRMALYPNIPQLSLIAPSSFKIELDPTNGLKFSKISDNAGSTVTSIPFQVSPSGNMILSGDIASTAKISGGTIEGAIIQTAASGERVRIDTTRAISFYGGNVANTPGSIYANDHAFYFTSPGGTGTNSTIQMYGSNAGGSLANSIRLWAGPLGPSENGITIATNEIRRNGAVGGNGTGNELRNIFATQSTTDVAGTLSTGFNDGTIRLNYTV